MAKSLRPEETWEISQVASGAILKEGLDGFSAGNLSPPIIYKIIQGTGLGGETYGSAYDEADNELLGVEVLMEEDLKKVAEQLVQTRMVVEGIRPYTLSSKIGDCRSQEVDQHSTKSLGVWFGTNGDEHLIVD